MANPAFWTQTNYLNMELKKNTPVTLRCVRLTSPLLAFRDFPCHASKKYNKQPRFSDSVFEKISVATVTNRLVVIFLGLL